MSEPAPLQGQSEAAALRTENTRLNKIITALMNRAERSAGTQGSDFCMFETAVRLEEQVHHRTAELETALRENEKINRALQQAKGQMEREIAERARIQRQLAIQYAVSQVLADSSSIADAAARTLDVIGTSFAWDAANFWTLDDRADVLECIETWHGSIDGIDDFKAASRSASYGRGVGLPGRAWAEAKPLWSSWGLEDASEARAAAARKAGLSTACVFPIVIESKVSGAVELFSRRRWESNEELLQTLSVLGSQLGQFLQQRRLEDQLLEAQKLETVGKLAGGIAHEFNSIMTAIIGQSELLLHGLPPNGAQAHGASLIRQAADRAATLTRQLLAFGRKQILQPVALDLNHIIGRMEGMLRHLMGEDVETRIILSNALPAVKADAGQIEQVLVNLAINARDAMPNGGKLTIETGRIALGSEGASAYPELKPGGYAMIAMTDTSTGMSPEMLAHVFEPFFSIKSIGHGAGLGLATCYGIIKQSGGHISVDSEPDRGTSFKVYLPEMQAEGVPRSRPAPSLALPRGDESILLVENDPALREMATSLLTRLGYKVTPAPDPAEALALAEQPGGKRFDLLFTDVAKPLADGRELSEHILALRPETKVVFTSAHTEKAIVHGGVLPPGAVFLPTPFTPSALANKVRQALDTK